MKRSVMKHLALLRIVVLAILWASVTLAEPRDPAARSEAYRTGYAAIERRDWGEAQRIFEELWREVPTYDVALHLGHAEFQLGRYREAAEHLAFGVAHLPPGESEALRERSVLALEQARTKVGTLAISVNQPSAEVHIDGALIGTAPFDGDRFVVPGRHRVEASLPGYQPASTMIEVRAGEQQEIALELTPLANATSASPAQDGIATGNARPAHESSALEPREMVLIGGVALTGVAAVTRVVFGLKSSSAAERAENLRAQASASGANACGGGQVARPAACAELHNVEDERTRASRVANISLGVAGVSALATAILYFAWPADAAEVAQRPAIVPLVNRGAQGLYVTGTF